MTPFARMKAAVSIIFGGSPSKISGRDAPDSVPVNLGNHAGKVVDQSSTLNLSAAWRCVRLRSGVVGALPIMVHKRSKDGSEPAKDHWLYDLVHESPNSEQTPAEFWGAMIASRDLWGDGFALKEFLGARLVALRYLRPDLMTVYRKDGRRRYRYAARDGQKDYSEEQVFHLRGFTIGGDRGLSAVAYGRHTLGLALAADETAAKTFQHGLQVSGFLKAGTGVRSTKEQREELVDLFAKFAGSSNTGKVMPLPDGWEFEALSMSPADAQLLQSRAFNVEDVCRWFETPPILVGHTSKSQTMFGSGVEQVMLGWVTLDLDPLLTGIEQAVVKQLLPAAERKLFFAEYNREALLQADSAAKAAFLSQMVQNGLMTRNEARQKLNLRRMNGGDELTAQTNLAPLNMLGAAQDAPANQIRSAFQRLLFGDSIEAVIEARMKRLAPPPRLIAHDDKDED